MGVRDLHGLALTLPGLRSWAGFPEDGHEEHEGDMKSMKKGNGIPLR
jgi:hypothetical protein